MMIKWMIILFAVGMLADQWALGQASEAKAQIQRHQKR
jgi:hypothetical protein